MTSLRNLFCGMLALSVIAAGRAGRERKRAFAGNIVTAIYFHKPSARLLQRCLQWLVKHGYHFISAGELVDILHHGKTPPKGAVWLSFDDGCKELLHDILPQIQASKIPVTLFLPTGIIAGDGRFPWLRNATRRETRDAIVVEDVIRAAMCPQVTLGSHTVTHTVMTRLTAQEAHDELAGSKQTLESWTGSEVMCFAYPEGRFQGREPALLRQLGYKLAATTENAFVTPETPFYLVPRFSVADDILFPEALCNMVGVWRPTIDPLIRGIQRVRSFSAWRPGTRANPKPSQSY